MTVVPENATLCVCWRDAPRWVREAEYFQRNHPTFSPRGLRACPDCRGAGWYSHWPSRRVGLR